MVDGKEISIAGWWVGGRIYNGARWGRHGKKNHIAGRVGTGRGWEVWEPETGRTGESIAGRGGAGWGGDLAELDGVSITQLPRPLICCRIIFVFFQSGRTKDEGGKENSIKYYHL